MTEAQKQSRIEALETELAHKRFWIAILKRLKEVLEGMVQRGPDGLPSLQDNQYTISLNVPLTAGQLVICRPVRGDGDVAAGAPRLKLVGRSATVAALRKQVA